MRRKAEIWLKGLGAAVIAGAANGVTTALAAFALEPTTFNMQDGLGITAKLVAASSAISAITGAASYLKQSPIPPPDTQDLKVSVAVAVAASAPKNDPIIMKDTDPAPPKGDGP